MDEVSSSMKILISIMIVTIVLSIIIGISTIAAKISHGFSDYTDNVLTSVQSSMLADASIYENSIPVSSVYLMLIDDKEHLSKVNVCGAKYSSTTKKYTQYQSLGANDIGSSSGTNDNDYLFKRSVWVSADGNYVNSNDAIISTQSESNYLNKITILRQYFSKKCDLYMTYDTSTGLYTVAVNIHLD